MPRLSFHPEVLGGRQPEVLEATAAPLSERGYRLAGGTALALVLGHRKSLDFDWFTAEAMGDPLRLARELEAEGIPLRVEQIGRRTLHCTVEGVRVSLLEFGYPALAAPISWGERAVTSLSLDDIAAMKLSAIAQRGSRKDFVDLYALLREHRPLAEMLRLYQQKFDVQEIGHLLYSLTYFEDAERQRMPLMLWKLQWPEIRREVERQVRELAAR